ncbi:hypothetical protein BC831DRAFT_492985, partial [Entophlyctis helioformis]
MLGLPWAGWLLCRAADPTDGSPMLLLVLLLVLLLLLRGTYLLPPRRRTARCFWCDVTRSVIAASSNGQPAAVCGNHPVGP